MNPRIDWLPAECRGPASDFWTRVVETSRDQTEEESKLKTYEDEQVGKKKIFRPCRDNIASTYGLSRSAYAHHLEVDSESPMTPWIPHQKKYSPGMAGLHEEILDFNMYMRPTRAEHKMRQDVIDRITKSVNNLFPNKNVRVDVFGSFKTELYLPTSDIDLVVFGDWPSPPLRQLREQLIKDGVCNENDVKELSRATVPIVKLTDKFTSVTVDISFNMKNSVKSAELIRRYMCRMPHLPYLVLVLKQFLLQRDLNEVFCGGISSYSLILLTISFLQLNPRYDSRITTTNLGILLIEFFELYGRNFNYFKTAITIRDRGSYKPKSELHLDNSGILCIEDPLEPTNDIGRSSYGVMQVKHAFEYAYVTLSNGHFLQTAGHNVGNGMLGRIIRIPEDVVKYREWVKAYYHMPVPVALTAFSTLPFAQMDAYSSDGSHSSRSTSPCEEAAPKKKEVLVSVTRSKSDSDSSHSAVPTTPNKRDKESLSRKPINSQVYKSKTRSTSSSGNRKNKPRATLTNGRTSR